MQFSVLMSVYSREHSAHLALSLQSLLNQTLPPDEIVLVKNGCLTKELDATIKVYMQWKPDLFNIISLKQDMGLSKALACGLQHCTYETVARMDSDDVSVPIRFERQLQIMSEHPHLDVVGSWAGEFVKNPSDISLIHQVPEADSEIKMMARHRDPMIHPSVMFRKHAVLQAGNYQGPAFLEDYELWIRMMQKGARFANVPEVLVLMRTGAGQYRRRGGLGYLVSEIRLQREFLQIGFISRSTYSWNILTRGGMAMLPMAIRAAVYRSYLRESP